MLKILITCLLLLIESAASCQTAVLNGKSLSLQINDATVIMGGYRVDFIFTTYDGNRYSLPYYYHDGTITYSRELKKLNGQYYTDYYSIINGTIDDYGEIVLNFGNIDHDANLIDDICEKDKSFSAPLIGNWYSYTGRSGPITGSATRGVNSQRGSFALNINNTWAGNISITSNFYVGVLSGSSRYSRQSRTITFNYITTWDTNVTSDPIATTFKVINNESIQIMGNDFFPTVVLNRSGAKYSTILQLFDGGLQTSWPDYQSWFVEIEDNNDTDDDGIPNLSDTDLLPKPNLSPIFQLLLE